MSHMLNIEETFNKTFTEELECYITSNYRQMCFPN